MDEKTWSIIRKSNYDHEDYRGDQYFVAIGIPQRDLAQRMTDALNNWSPESDDYYAVVESDYRLPPPWGP